MKALEKKKNFLLYGFDCRSPTEAALHPPHLIKPTDVSDYRQEFILSLAAVKLGQGNINANRDFQCIFHYCGGRAGQFVCQRRYRNQFSPLWRS